jgi:hypothetical protein
MAGLAVSILALMILAGCAARPAAPPREAPTREAEVSYRIESPGDEGRHALTMGQTVAAPPGPLEDNPLPEYPIEWLARELPPIELGMLVTVDTRGRAHNMRLLPGAAPLPCDDRIAAFSAALADALQQWNFRPLEIHGWADGPDVDGDGEADSVVRALVDTRPYSLRLHFRFEVRDGKPQVSALP